MNKISFLGLGAMGERMARSLSRAGYKLTVFNRSADRAVSLVELGARSFDTPRDAVSDSDIVISMVTDDGASRAIWLDEHHGALNGIKKGHICIEMSTVTPAWARDDIHLAVDRPDHCRVEPLCPRFLPTHFGQ